MKVTQYPVGLKKDPVGISVYTVIPVAFLFVCLFRTLHPFC